MAAGITPLHFCIFRGSQQQVSSYGQWLFVPVLSRIMYVSYVHRVILDNKGEYMDRNEVRRVMKC